MEGGSRFGWEDTPDGKACWIAAIVGAGTAVLSVGWQFWVVKKRVAQDLEEAEQAKAASAADAAEAPASAANGDAKLEGKEEGSEEAAARPQTTPAALRDFRKSKVWTAMTHSANVDIHKVGVTGGVPWGGGGAG